MKKLSAIIIGLSCLSCLAGCTDIGLKDDGSRAFVSKATVIGDGENGYYCYSDVLPAIACSDAFAGIERGYFTFTYTESDWTTAPDGKMYIAHVHAYPIDVYDIIHPLSAAEAEKGELIDKERCTVPERLTVDHAANGYVDLSSQFSTFNQESGAYSHGDVRIVYDPALQEPDTLRLQLYYIPSLPDGWTKTSSDYRTVSCDLSSLASLCQWNDSLTLVVDDGDQKKHCRRMSKKNFQKPRIGAE